MRCVIVLLLLVAACQHHPDVVVSSSGTDVYLKMDPATRKKIQDWKPSVATVDGDFECGRVDVAPNRIGIVASFPTRKDAAAEVILTLDSTHTRMVRYAERRGPRIQPAIAPDMTPEQVGLALKAANDSLAATNITIDFERNSVSAVNHGPRTANDRINGTIEQMVYLPALADPLGRIRRVRAKCDPGYSG